MDHPMTRPDGPTPRLLTPRDVYSRVCMSRATIHRRVRAGAFPQPVRLGPNRKAWRESDVTAWIEAQTAGN